MTATATSTIDALSALMKSLRGSDADAALHYLARLLEAGDLVGACRRILCSAERGYRPCVSAGGADSQGLRGLGAAARPAGGAPAAGRGGHLPRHRAEVEQRRHGASTAAIADVRAGKGGPLPRELQNVHADGTGFEREQGYKYPHSYPNHWVRQQYLPDALKGAHYYDFGDNKIEQAAKKYWDEIKK